MQRLDQRAIGKQQYPFNIKFLNFNETYIAKKLSFYTLNITAYSITGEEIQAFKTSAN